MLIVSASTPSFGQATDDVNVTVTLQNVSVTVADGAVNYGTQGTSTVVDTTSNGIDDSQTATNNGNVAVDLNLRGQDTAAWTLAGSIGADQYRHRFCTTTCDSSPSWTALTTNYQSLASSVNVSGNQVFDLEINTPSSTSSFTQQLADVIVQAVAP